MCSLQLTDAWELLKMTAQVDWVWIYINITQNAIFLLTAYMYSPWNLENQKFFLKVIVLQENSKSGIKKQQW